MENPFADEISLPLSPEEQRKSNSAGKTSPAEQGGVVPMDWKKTIGEPIPVVRCTANASTTGEQCKRWSLRGTNVCVKHGAQLPHVREHAEAVVESARMRIMGLTDLAVDGLEELVQPGTAPQVRLAAIKEVLDRGGLKGAPDLTVEHTVAVSYKDEIQNRLNDIRERKLKMQQQADEDILDAEEIPAADNDTEGTDGITP